MGGVEGNFSVSFGPKPGFRLWIRTWTKLNNSFNEINSNLSLDLGRPIKQHQSLTTLFIRNIYLVLYELQIDKVSYVRNLSCVQPKYLRV